MNTELGRAYAAQLNEMLTNADRWRRENPGREVRVQFNFPAKVCVIAPISTALKEKYVTTNEAWLELLKALWPWDVDSEPTVMMVRGVLEFKE